MKKIIYLIIIAFAVGTFSSCKQGDEIYEEFIVPGGLTYPQKADSLKAYSGINRVKLEWFAPSDPSVISAKVFWHNYTDSLELAMSDIPAGNQRISVFINDLKVGPYTFYVKTYDDKGNVSVTANVTVTVFDDKYGLSLEQEPVILSTMNERGEWIIQFGALSGAFGDEIEYRTIDASTKTVVVDASNERTAMITDFEVGSIFRYRTIYFNENSYVDSVYTDYYEGRTPYVGAYPDGIPHQPGIIEAEHFDTGGEGISYHDNTVGNGGDTKFRTEEDVDIYHISNPPNGNYFIGWNGGGEWLRYTVNVPETGTYRFAFHVGTASGSSIDLVIDGQPSITVPIYNTGWAWSKIEGPDVVLSAGIHVFILQFLDAGMNFDKFEFNKQTTIF